MADILSKQTKEDIPFSLTESDKFFLKMFDAMENDQENNVSWEHDNGGQPYKQIFEESYNMKTPEEREAIQEYLKRKK